MVFEDIFKLILILFKKYSGNSGRLVKTESGNCVDEYGYDWMGNVIKHKRTIKGLDGKKTEYNSSYSYDYFGRMKTMKLPDGEIVTYGYNKGGQLSGVGSSKGKPYVSGIKYNLNGQRTKIEYGNGTGTSYEYDERNHRLKRLETRNAKSILQTIEYEYDATGNVTERESEMLGTDGRMKRAVHEYEYDSSGRLTEGSGKVERMTGGILRPNIVSYKSKYNYDTIGNILTKTQAVNGGESYLSCDDTYTYGGKQPHAVTKAGAMVFTYDDNGNMIKRENTETKNTMTLVWDDENRLIKTTDSLHTTDYRYDANGERIIKKSELGETQYVSANYIVRNKTVISKHVFAGNQRIASTVSMKNNCGTMTEQNTMYFHPDHLGSSSYVTDKKGNFFEMIEYLPYGETLYDEAATVDKTEFRFTGHLKDDETGFYYCHARYYDPKIGKFLTPDDRIDGLFSSAGQNMYMYCHGNTIMFNDPDGHDYEDAKGNTRRGETGQDTPVKGGEFGWKKAEPSYKGYSQTQNEKRAAEFNEKVKVISEQNKDNICWTSPKRESRPGYPEWAYTPKLENLYNNLIDTGAYEIAEQIGDAYITAIYNNPMPYFTRLNYQLPNGVGPKSDKPSARWKNNKYIMKNKSRGFWYIDNVHFLDNGKIHWDPNNPQEGFLYNSEHVIYDYGRVQTPEPKFIFSF